jgi:hypothetical protein
MRARTLVRGLATIATAMATAVVPMAAPAHAGNVCPSQDALVASATGAVRNGDPDWYAFSTAEATSVTLVPTSGDPDLKVMDQGCGTVVCYPYAGGVETCALPPGSYQVGVLYFSGSGGVAGYGLSAGTTECNDGIDNDGDGQVDYPSDPGCSGPGDASEGVRCTVISGHQTCVGFDGSTVTVSGNLSQVTTVPGPAVHVVGYQDLYRFRLPQGAGTVNVPCVVLVANATTGNPCQAAGGEFVSRASTLVDRTEQPTVPAFGDPLATVEVCRGELVASVDGIGITSFAGYGLCDSVGLSGGGGTAH